jgi:type II secretory pathway pseudopilin PulG
MRLRDARSALRAFTLAESLVATMVIGIAFAALAVASVALQRSLYSARDYSNALNIQTRIADYIRRDLRNALDAGVDLGGKRIWIDLPDDYDLQGNPVDPTIGPGQKVIYTTAGARMRIRYYVNGANFVREGAGSTTVIAPNAGDFAPSFTPVNTAGVLTAIKFSLTHSGKFGAKASTDPIARQATQLNTVLSLRNKQAALPTPAPTPASPPGKRKGRT